MSFFTDPTISTLTSGRPSQNVDLGGLSFPRRLGVRFNSEFIKYYHLAGMQARWESYEDDGFTKSMGKKFFHEDLVTREGWARYYFEGKYPNDVAYIKMEIVNPQTNMLIRTFYFKFTKSYMTSLDARYYVKDPILEEKIVKNGLLVELKPFKKKDGTIVYRKGKTTFRQTKVVDVENQGDKVDVQTNAIIRTMVRYSERPKMVFLVTPPHLMKYAKLILILVKQLVDLNFDKSYMTKSSQKPLAKTRFMLDELGNLQSEGHGIANFQTMLSIGLGQEQQFTLILQTLQQLRDVYGDSVDKIVQGNTSNIVFLKSTDDSMLDTLQKMSGITHKTYADSKTVTRDMERIWMQNEGKMSITMTTKEVPVITYNDMAFIAERNSIVFRAGDSPIWNRNQTILPMSWRLFQNTIVKPGKEFSLQTIPTLSSALDFDVRKNQPDFEKMLDKRMNQALRAQECKDMYQSVYEYSDYEVSQLDPDNYSDEIMDMINRAINRQDVDGSDRITDEEAEFNAQMEKELAWSEDAEANTDQIAVTNKIQFEYEQRNMRIYAGRNISKDDLVSKTGISHGFDNDIISVYTDIRGSMEQDRNYFTVDASGGLCGLDGTPYIVRRNESAYLAHLNNLAKDKDSYIYSEEDISEKDLSVIGTYEVTDAFYRFLASLDRWDFAKGEFEKAMARRVSGG